MASQGTLNCLSETFGQIPRDILESAKFFSYDSENDDFTCVLCNKIIQTVKCDEMYDEESTTRNFHKHLLSHNHQRNCVSFSDLCLKLKSIFQGNIPQIVNNNLNVLNIIDGKYKCAICDKNLNVSQNSQSTEANFSKHLMSYEHKENLQEFRETISNLHDIYGGIPDFIMSHSQFLSKNGNYYTCNICNKHIQVHPSDIDITENNFREHLRSLKHVKNAKVKNAFSLHPELEQVFNYHLPNYMLRNIEYISVNGANFFCCLCFTNIKFNRHNHYETEQNFKLHMSSSDHEENLSHRRNTDDKAFNILHELFEEFSDVVLENLKYLSVDGDNFYCTVCEQTIEEGEDDEETRDNLIFHFEESGHENVVDDELQRQSDLIMKLEDVFGSIPERIKDNVKYIEFMGGNNFRCILCDKTMQSKINGDDYEHTTSVTEENFVKHLDSDKHRDEVEKEENDEDLQNDLEELFSIVPQYIMNNLEHLGYENNSNNFYCVLCDKTIAIVNGNKKEECTEQNFRSHLLSVGHMAKLKYKANKEMEVIENLELIFNEVPNYILSNIEHITDEDGHFFCSLCDAQIMVGKDSTSSEQTFRSHIFGNKHRSNVEKNEEENGIAMQRFDESFLRIPEFILRNIDFIYLYGSDELYCSLCQRVLNIDEDDLKATKWNLRCHIESLEHQHHLKSM
uniref:U1-type domain-containing protein n=1 Tax=Homalodisca liturata TaxID=320908 RepID=A0A1B6HH56_9HEMI